MTMGRNDHNSEICIGWPNGLASTRKLQIKSHYHLEMSAHNRSLITNKGSLMILTNTRVQQKNIMKYSLPKKE